MTFQRAAIAQFAEAEGLKPTEQFEKFETGKGSDALDRRPHQEATGKRALMSRRRSIDQTNIETTDQRGAPRLGIV
jgi:hypothetical protein